MSAPAALVALVATAGCVGEEAANAPLADILADMDEVLWFAERDTATPDYQLFEIVFEQPVDHTGTTETRFGQHLTLMHKSYDAPMVLASTGYHNFLADRLSEPALLLGANQIVIEHRYFGDSRPVPPDWSHLDIAQAAADHHRIVDAFAALYEGAWVSTGASKGGMTSVFHRRFYPDDVDATVAYVAPISFAISDTRYEPFLDQVGTVACRQTLRAFQRDALARRTALAPLAGALADAQGLTFERLGGIQKSLEIGIIEFEWGFWQYMGPDFCDFLPTEADPDEAVLAFLEEINAITMLADQELAIFEPYYYQSFTELGYPSIPLDHLADLLQFDYETDLAGLLPSGVRPTYDAAAMRDIADWVATEGTQLLLVYGAHDPWTGGALELGHGLDAHRFIAPQTGHGAKIADLTPEAQGQALAALQSWTGETISVTGIDFTRLAPPVDRMAAQALAQTLDQARAQTRGQARAQTRGQAPDRLGRSPEHRSAHITAPRNQHLTPMSDRFGMSLIPGLRPAVRLRVAQRSGSVSARGVQPGAHTSASTAATAAKPDAAISGLSSE